MKRKELKCDGCPALPLRTKDQLHRIKQWEKLRTKEIETMIEIKLYLLCESIPANRFFYDLDSEYDNGGLRYNLKEELELDSDYDVLEYFSQNGIVLADCALCPLHQLDSNTEKRHAATFCLKNNTYKILDINPNAPIVTIFPKHRGYLKTDFPEIEKRKVDEFSFNNLYGLKAVIDHYSK